MLTPMETTTIKYNEEEASGDWGSFYYDEYSDSDYYEAEVEDIIPNVSPLLDQGYI